MLTLSHDESISIKNNAEWPPLCHLQTTTKNVMLETMENLHMTDIIAKYGLHYLSQALYDITTQYITSINETNSILLI